MTIKISHISKISAAVLAASMLVTPAVAGEGIFAKANGDRVKLSCKSSGCFVNGRKIGPGGSANYRKLVREYKSRGYKTKCTVFNRRKAPCNQA